ncbi:hypothetical protein SSX86_012166 [Deinandra increscens subsp. villosa]|uniref:Uncharacterized protein n=1 Tax=Deinandra increscens subsp. villosa TaxID=3103831 RepID=A0AAP0H308_9ASTR
MERKRDTRLPEVFFMLLLTFTNIVTITSANSDQSETYIVHLNAPDGVTFDKPEDRQSWYNSFLTASSTSSNVEPSLIHAYHNVFTGFAAKLSAEQVKAMENMDGFVSARPERVYKLHTTHTPRFLGLHRNLGFWGGSNYGKGIIIGVLDTGITPGHPSFADKGVPPPPAKWKGKCEVAGCNNKLIGARDFTSSGSSGSPLDDEGHGTHTSGTAAGNFVDGANVFGNAKGTAAGMAPLAHLAMYKVCDSFGCPDSSILAGMDAAIEEGVDVLSLSLGGASVPFYEDGIAVGAFSAIQRGIFVSCSAANSGPFNSTLSNEAPWILTVGASTLDRNIRSVVSLGNKDLLNGESLFQPKDFPQNFLPLVYPGLNGSQDASWCAAGSLKNIDVKGKVVVCDRGGGIARIAKGQTVKDAGGAAMILANELIDGDTTEADAHVLPASHVGYVVGYIIKTYINSTSSPVATILFEGTVLGVDSAPAVASFSSRGPSLASPGIVKPDIIGPGVSILAAWPISVENSTLTKATFNMISGTSMSCPHLAGISALLKSAHPDWSPAAIKSAIMTTAGQVSLSGQRIEDERDLPANIFAIGSGHVNPSKANDPGLIFDIQPNDYIPYLCGLGYTSKQVGIIVQKRVTCSKVIPEAQLNYPSFAVTLGVDQIQTYIVHLNAPDGVTFDKPEDRQSWYNSFLTVSSTGSNVEPSLIHAYHNVFTGFAAKLSAYQVKAMENMDGFVSARPETVYKLHTTQTPRFLGLHQNLGLWRGSNYGKGIIIGVLDTGITPGHPSFDDKGVPSPPAKWKGKCEVAGCNNKLIGARDFTSSGSGSPLDDEGHGTHTSGTAAGNFVNGANVFGNAKGTAAGMAPLAHLAMYKVCDSFGCPENAILAAMDAAIEEGVDVLSLSLGGASVPFYADGIAVGAFSAIQKGIFVSCSAANSGPFNSTLSNEAPWILTVGASTIDRNIRSTVYLGSKDLLDGESLFQPKNFPQKYLPLVYPGLNGSQDTAWCAAGSLENVDVKGKVVLCDRGGGIARIAKGQTVKDAGGAVMILTNELIDGDTTEADAHVLPASHVASDVGVEIKTYINSTSSPVATLIFRGTVAIGVEAPQVASFSSRGPSVASPGIVKPDIIGPGVSILAAWPVSVDNSTLTNGTFNMISGTSMSCPHLSGISALLKSAHPDWSPAAIKSAIMTSASQRSLSGQRIEDERDLPASIFAIGSGHVNPSKANDPGLIFDIQPDDYIPYLCGLGYTSKQVGVIVQKRVTCSTVIPEAELNYPSFAVTLGAGEIKRYKRTVTNVGAANSTYAIYDLSLPIGLGLEVLNSTLEFSEVNQKLSYEMVFIYVSQGQTKSYAEGHLTWGSDNHLVRTPFSVKFV